MDPIQLRNKYTIIKAFNFFIFGALSIYSTFFALYLQEIGWSTLEIGGLMAGGPVVSLFANPFWGYMSDRFRNLRMVLIIMLACAMLLMLVVFLAQSPVLIYSTMFLFFFFQVPIFSQSNSLILNTIEGTPHNFGAFRLWGSLGWAIMAASAGPVIGRIGVDKLWILFTIMMLLSILFAFGLPRGEARSKGNRRRRLATVPFLRTGPFFYFFCSALCSRFRIA